MTIQPYLEIACLTVLSSVANLGLNLSAYVKDSYFDTVEYLASIVDQEPLFAI